MHNEPRHMTLKTQLFILSAAVGLSTFGTAYGQLPPTRWQFGENDRENATATAAVPEWQNPEIAHVGRETPRAIAFLPLRTGRVFEEHVRQAGGERESQEQDSR